MSEDVKKVIATLINQFVTAESGNRVTENNMMALHMKINMALDGAISMKAPEEDKS